MAITPDPVLPAEPPSLLALLPIVLGLREVLARRGEVTIRAADLDDADLLGIAEFATGTVHLAHDLTDEEWRPTLVHELLHLLRGPAGRDGAADEERDVERITLEVEQAMRLRARGATRPVGEQGACAACGVDPQGVTS